MQDRFNYQSRGEGPAFHFQHGLGSNLNQPQALLQDLEGFRLISMDCPGHGEAPLAANTLPSFDYYADQLVHLMDQLNIEKGIFGGISMGAGISMNIALRYPDRVRALVLVRPAWLDQGTPANLRILLEAAQCIGRSKGREVFMERFDFQDIKAVLPNAANSVLGVFAETQRAEIPVVLRSMVKDCPFNDLTALSKIIAPCLVIGNEDDPLHPLDMAEIIHRVIPNSQFKKVISRYVDDAAHRDIVNQTVIKFISNL